MSKSDELWSKLIQHHGNAPRELVVAYTRAVIEEAQQVPMRQLAARGTADTMSSGEIIASKLITGLAQQGWLDEDNEPELEKILSIAGQLDMNVGDHKLWQELFRKAEQLRV